MTRLLYFVVLLVAALALSNNSADPDFWGHVQYGRDLLQAGLPWTSTYSYTSAGYSWINHENLAEIFFALVVDSCGVSTLLVAKCLAGVLVIWLALRTALRQGADRISAISFALLLASSLLSYWSTRPQIFSYVGFALMLEILSRGFVDWRTSRGTTVHWKWLAWLVPLFLVWTNSHGGFLAGVFTLAAYLGCRSCEAFWFAGKRAWPITARLVAISLAVGVTTLANPYGIGLLVKLYYKLSVPRPEISEWHPPQFDNPYLWPLWLMLAVAVLAVLFSRRKRDATQLVILAATLWQTLEHARHVPFFVIAAAWFLPEHFSSVMRRLAAVCGERFGRSFALPAMARSMQVAMVTGVMLVIGGLSWQLATTLRVMPVLRDEYPVSAVEFMVERKLSGKIVACFDWSQYLIAALGAKDADQPGLRVQFDGRFRTCYSQEILDMHFDFILGMDEPRVRYRSPHSPPCEAGRVLEFMSPNLVLIDRKLGHAVRTMREQSANWTLLYQDDLAQIWGRASEYDVPESPLYIAPQQRRVGNDLQLGYAVWPATPQISLNSRSQVLAWERTGPEAPASTIH